LILNIKVDPNQKSSSLISIAWPFSQLIYFISNECNAYFQFLCQHYLNHETIVFESSCKLFASKFLD